MRVAVCVFAKPPQPGKVKTRLAATLGHDAAAALAFAFFQDTWEKVRNLPGVQPVLAVPEPSKALSSIVGDAPVWLQEPGDLGRKMENIAVQAFAAGFAAVVHLGADSPLLPPAYVLQAVQALQHHDAVLGPSDDGGFYLLALRRHVPGLLADLPWSQPDTRDHTERRLRALGFSLAHVPTHFDVDDGEDLERLRALLKHVNHGAPHTAAALARLFSAA